ncbi:LptA/OstA family protein [Pelosinus sp. sgz500959]|uniref:LptA/OstA family protein n=1 Tax=Pelosinus sp. sgz500959 TaxID=3242472 RepID=UPI00366F202B
MKAKILTMTLLVIVLFTATAMAAKPIIKADQQYLDINTGLYMLDGNVYIEVKNRIITAGQAKVSLASLEVWGTGGITVTQDDIYFTGDKVYVYGSSERATIEGNINFSRTNTTVTADRVDYSWRDKNAVFSGNVKVTQNDNTFTADSIKYNIETNTFF